MAVPPRVLGKSGTPVKPTGSYDTLLDEAAAPGHDSPGCWTLLTAEGATLTKRWFAARVNDYPFQRQEGALRPASATYKAEPVSLSTLADIEALRRRIEPNQMLIPGGLMKSALRKPLVRAVANRRKSYRAFVDVPRTAWMIDIDSTDVASPEDWLKDPECVTDDVIEAHLPELFRPAGVTVAAGSSMGPKFSLHLFYTFDRPVWSFEMKHWLGPAASAELLDGSLYTPAHPHFIAPPLFYSADGRPAPDPLEDVRVFTLEGDPVAVPEVIREFVKPKRSRPVNKDGTEAERPPWRDLLQFVGRGDTREGYHEFMNTQLIPAFCTQVRRWFPEPERRAAFKEAMREHLREAIRAEPTTDPRRRDEALGNEFDRMFDDHWDWRQGIPDNVVEMAGRKIRGEPPDETLEAGMSEARQMIDQALDFWTRGR